MLTLTSNEMDVRSEVAEPFLAALGYKRGTVANIDREFRLIYARHFLGRKKQADKPLVGKADYRLSVLGYGNWVLDTKASHVEISKDDIEQAISYARHPEVAGYYAAVLNGRRFVLYRSMQASNETPTIDLPVTTPELLAKALTGLLSPAAIRRDCRPPIVDLGTPLAPGLRSEARLVGGHMQYRVCNIQTNFELPPAASDELSEVARRLSSFRASVTGGRISRDETSRIRARLCWGAPEPNILKFAIDKHLFDVEYVTLDDEISTDPAAPSAFDAIGAVCVQKGEQVFDFLRWRTKFAEIDTEVSFRGRAAGALDGSNFIGNFQSEMIVRSPLAPDFVLAMQSEGEIVVEADVT